MLVRLVMTIAFLTFVGCPLSRVALADTTRIPATEYPVGATISYRPGLSNQQMDCLWGFFCEGHAVLFHFSTQNQLRRVAGWAQFAGLCHHGHMVMSFELFASRYQIRTKSDGTTWSKRAFDDFVGAGMAHGYKQALQQSRWLTVSPKGESTVRVLRDSTSELVIMAAWRGDMEVEGIVMIDHPSAPTHRVALHDLASHVLRALASM